MSRWQKFLRRSGRERLLFVEALAGLCWDKARVHLLPFHRIARTFGAPQRETAKTISSTERAIAVEISWAVQAAARHAPISFVCLPQAIAAQRMLRRRGIASTLYLGVAPDRADPALLQAHAWLRAGDKILTGELEAVRHRPLAWFGWESPD
ncbi:MAG: lasso peptide biosynthesis B2 protein [Candidatus Didemnitutus sp.]|nr:lasso peptide biosynthesis B2 protein [Candidatus Didemnitutus sp.]